MQEVICYLVKAPLALVVLRYAPVLGKALWLVSCKRSRQQVVFEERLPRRVGEALIEALHVLADYRLRRYYALNVRVYPAECLVVSVVLVRKAALERRYALPSVIPALVEWIPAECHVSLLLCQLSCLSLLSSIFTISS